MGKVTGEEGWISLGPWGPRGWSQRSRSEASYKADGPVMEMTVHYSQLSPISDTVSIDAISFQSESCDGVLIGCSEMIGSSHGKMTQKVRIDSSVDQLLSISLTYNTFYMTSLTFHTNRNKYGPIGPFDEKDTTFSMPMDAGVIVGFYGCEEVDRGNRLIAIGVFVVPKVKSLHSIPDPYDRPSKDKKIEEKQKSKIKELEDYVDELVMKMKELEADAKNEVLRKKNEEMEKAVVHLQKREEELKEESRELKLETRELKLETKEVKKEIRELEAKNEVMRKKNKETEKKKVEEEFKIEIKELKKELEEVAAENKVLKHRNEAMRNIIVIEGGAIPLGPWGGHGGSFWAYKTNVAPIMEITLRYGDLIDSVLFRNYRRLNGDVVECSNRIGGTGGSSQTTISIDSSEEQLISISLTTYNEAYISSLSFHSNRKSYGPYGNVYGPAVSIPIDGVLVGFHGRSGIFLQAIGILVASKVLNS